MDYQSFDASSCDFPTPRVPVLPTLGRQSLRVGNSARTLAFTSSANARFYARGRYALTDACRLSNVGADTAVLAPAYHCRTMLDPAIRLGAEIALYPLGPDLSPDMDGLVACLAACAKPAAALLVTHYFGLQQKLDALLEFCNHHGMALIEDCSHCLFVPSDTSDLGRLGRYNVSSPYKFFPSEDGGVLWANHGAALPSNLPQAVGAIPELKSWVRTLQRAGVRGLPLRADALEQELARVTDVPKSIGHDRLRASAVPSPHYDLAQESLGSLAASRWIMRHTDTERVIAQRRKHYLQWLQVVAGLPHCRALLPVLPVACVPYMFPIYITHPEPHFFALKRLGVPVWRWDDMAVSSCSVAMDCRLRVLHLPCHQELTEDQMAWMTSTFAKVMTQIANRPVA